MTRQALTVLVVEDNQADARWVALQLEEAAGSSVGCVVTDTLSGALRVLSTQRCDVVLLDLGLPDSVGLDTFRAIDRAMPHVPVLVLTGLRDEDLATRAVRIGAQDYLVKGETTADGLSRAVRYAIERKRVQAELRSYADALVETMHVGLAIWRKQDGTGGDALRLVAHNPAAQTLGGVDLEAGVGSRLRDLFPVWAQEGLAETLGRVSELGEPEDLGERQLGLGADRGVYLVKAFPMPDASVGLTFEDITVQRRAEEERARLERRLRNTQKLESMAAMAGGIAHDFNNLLQVVQGNVDLAQRSLAADHPARELVRRVDEATRKATELTAQMLAFSGQGHFVVEAVDLSALIGGAVRLLESSVGSRVPLVLELDDDLPSVEGDRAQLRQLLLSLVVNAAEASTEGGVVRLSTELLEIDEGWSASAAIGGDLPPGEYVALRVEDEGVGLDPQVLPRIFDPFFTTRGAGRGLGLASVSGIVRGHRGGLDIRSAVGRGTVVEVLLPLRSEPALEPLPSVGDVIDHEARTVLVVDDEPGVRALLEVLLAGRGLDVLVACDGEEGLAVWQAERDHIGLVLLDLTMPRMGGGELLRALRRRGSSVPVLLMSGYAQEEVVGRFTGMGLTGFIQKPFKVAAMLERIEETLGGGTSGG